MNWRDFRFISENTLEALSLHDCRIKHASFSDHTLILEMDYINVLADHPLNEFPVAKCTGEAQLVFENVVVEESYIEDTSLQEGPVIDAALATKLFCPITELAENFEILTHTCLSDEASNFVYHFYGDAWPNKYRKNRRNDCAIFTIRFSNVFACWNELEVDAWFVNWP